MIQLISGRSWSSLHQLFCNMLLCGEGIVMRVHEKYWGDKYVELRRYLEQNVLGEGK